MTTINITINVPTEIDSEMTYSFDSAKIDKRGNLILNSRDDGDCAFGTFATELREVIKYELGVR